MSAAPAFAPTHRHVVLLRAVMAAVAALMITFSPDHSAPLGLTVFGGWAIATGLILGLGAWLAEPAGERMLPTLQAVFFVIAGMAASIPDARTTLAYVIIIPLWAAITGLIEICQSVAERRRDRARRAKDSLLVGVLTAVLAVATLLVPGGYALDYAINDQGVTHAFTLTGEVIWVGIFGGYAAIVAVFLGIAGLSPRQPVAATAPTSEVSL